MIVRTVTGDVTPDELGHTQCHEHLFIERGPSFDVTPVLLMDDLEKTTRELFDYAHAGGGTVVDAQPAWYGRMTEYLVVASNHSRVRVVASTGFHKSEFATPDCPLFSMDTDAITDYFVSEIEHEISGGHANQNDSTVARAGIIKTALNSNRNIHHETEMKLLEAAVSAARVTGAALLCHTEPGIRPLEFIEQIAKWGLPTNRVIFSHLDRTCPDWPMVADALDSGIYVTFDTIHRFKYRSDESEREWIARAVGEGHGRQVMLSLDTTNQRLRHYGGEIGLDYILRSFLPVLRCDGLGETDLYEMTIGNAARVLPLQPLH